MTDTVDARPVALQRVLICVATYRRPQGLADLLDSIATGDYEGEFDILVVDNDPAAGAREYVQGYTRLDRPVTYVHEPTPGIAAARNRALDHVAGYQAMIFVDDDEIVTQTWLSELLAHAGATDAEVITGPVVSEFPDHTPRWVRKGGFIQRPVPATGTRLEGAATNNTLVRTDFWVRAGSPRFDVTFSRTGGSDSAFFAGLRRSGARMEFCATAPVREPVPDDRMTVKWLSRRALRNGVVCARIWSVDHGRPAICAKGALTVVGGVGQLVWSLVRLRGVQAAGFNRTLNGIGVLFAGVGGRIHEYRRPA
ncbi:glycosyltransferase family 2 protein [Nakamurella silvestris]|nr:glycosyltransferase family 2 protein [Nakamurella silvestris]